MIERNHEVRQGAIAALLSVAALTGSIYTGKALDYRDVFIPGTTINGIDAADRTVKEMEELLGMADRLVIMSKGRMSGVLEKNEFSQERVMRMFTGAANE